MPKKIRVIITGASGMVGEGVLHECLNHPDVEAILSISRKPNNINHPKFKEIVHQNFFDLSAIENELNGYNSCFFCLGVSSIGMRKDEYYKLTYGLTMHVAETLSKLNAEMTFCYISGAGTDSTEKGSSSWARVKGKTENNLMKLPFRKAYAFRPGFIKPTPGLKNTQKYYRYVTWLFPLGRSIYPRGFCTLKELGLAMIKTAKDDYKDSTIEGNDIIEIANDFN